MAGNLNRALLIGVVARPAEVDAAGWRLTVAIPTEGDGGLHVERVDVTGDARLSALVADLHSAQLVYVEGRVARGAHHRVEVRAASVMALADPPAPPEPSGPGGGTHAPPRAHERAGHARVLYRGRRPARPSGTRRGPRGVVPSPARPPPRWRGAAARAEEASGEVPPPSLSRVRGAASPRSSATGRRTS